MLEEITKELVKMAKIELFVKNNKIDDNRESFDYYYKNYKNDLTYYKQEKNSGFSYIILYKGVRISCFDFMTFDPKNIPETKIWNVYNLEKLKRIVLSNIFKNPWDERKTSKYKPTAEKYWKTISKLLI